MPRQALSHQCKTCGAVVMARDRRAHLNERHQQLGEALATTQISVCFTTTIDPFHPGRADKWGYSDEEIGVVIPGLEPTSGEETSDV